MGFIFYSFNVADTDVALKSTAYIQPIGLHSLTQGGCIVPPPLAILKVSAFIFKEKKTARHPMMMQSCQLRQVIM